jgi:curved DNA-binding protein CbpA
MESRRTLYDELGVSYRATVAEIGRGYERQMAALKDETGPVTERARASLTRAYATLSDPDLRDRYHSAVGLPRLETVGEHTKESKAWQGRYVGGGLAAVGAIAVAALMFWPRPQPAIPPPQATTPASAEPAYDPTTPVMRPPPEAKRANTNEVGEPILDDKTRREFESARRNLDQQRRQEEFFAQRSAEQERRLEEMQRRRAEYEAQIAQERERRELQRRQREELEQTQRKLREIERQR